jgi:DNA-binding beta-propeller fold protein YncE
MVAIDAISGKKIWDKTYEGGCDRMAISPDGKLLYVPQLEGPKWHVVNAGNGKVIAAIEPKSGSHNTIFAADGSRVYLAGLKSTSLSIADPKTHTITRTVGPFENVIRPFYRQWQQHTGFRQYQRPAGLRSRRHSYRQEVASSRSAGLQAGPRQTA